MTAEEAFSRQSFFKFVFGVGCFEFGDESLPTLHAVCGSTGKREGSAGGHGAMAAGGQRSLCGAAGWTRRPKEKRKLV